MDLGFLNLEVKLFNSSHHTFHTTANLVAAYFDSKIITIECFMTS